MNARVGKGSLSGMLLMAVFLACSIELGDEPIHSRFLPDEVMNSLKTLKTFEPPDSNVPGRTLKERLLFDMAATHHDTPRVIDPQARAIGDEKTAKEGGITVQQRKTLARNITPEFRRYMLYFLNPFRVPDEEFIRSHLTFLESAHSVSGADVAYLDYEVDGRAIRVAQTGEGGRGSIGICIELKPADFDNAVSPQACTAAINRLFAGYLVADPDSSFAIGSLDPVGADAGANYWVKPLKNFDGYRQYLFGAISARGVCIVFQRKHPSYNRDEHPMSVDPPLPAHNTPPEEWFDKQEKGVSRPQAAPQVDKKNP